MMIQRKMILLLEIWVFVIKFKENRAILVKIIKLVYKRMNKILINQMNNSIVKSTRLVKIF